MPVAARCSRQSRDARARIGQQVGAVDDEQRPAVDADVARDRGTAARGRAIRRDRPRGEYSCAISTSSSRPSQRRVQFSLAQHTQNGKSGSPLRSTSSSGRSSSRRAVEPVVVVAEAVDAVARAPAPPARRASPGRAGRSSRGRAGGAADSGPAKLRLARARRCVHSVKPLPHQASFSGIGWNCGR